MTADRGVLDQSLEFEALVIELLPVATLADRRPTLANAPECRVRAACA